MEQLHSFAELSLTSRTLVEVLVSRTGSLDTFEGFLAYE